MRIAVRVTFYCDNCGKTIAEYDDQNIYPVFSKEQAIERIREDIRLGEIKAVRRGDLLSCNRKCYNKSNGLWDKGQKGK